MRGTTVQGIPCPDRVREAADDSRRYISVSFYQLSNLLTRSESWFGEYSDLVEYDDDDTSNTMERKRNITHKTDKTSEKPLTAVNSKSAKAQRLADTTHVLYCNFLNCLAL